MPTRRRQFDKLTEPSIRKVLKALRKSLKKMRGIARTGEGTDFDLFAARQKAQALEREVDALETELVARVKGAARDAVPLADEVNADAPDNLVGIDANIAARAEADAGLFVRNVTEKMRREINAATVAAVTGEGDRASFDRALGRALDVDANEARVERIARTELGKVFEDQGAEADARLADAGSDLLKKWSHKCSGRMCFGARADHVAIHGQERELREEFNVGGGATKKTPPGPVGEKALRPLASTLSAKNVIHCGCTAIRIPRRQAKQSYTAKVNPRAAEAIR